MPEGIYKEIKAVYKRNRRQRIFDMGHRIIFATGNEGKMREIRLILADLGLPILSMKEAGAEPEIVENGATFGENAEIKARACLLYTSRRTSPAGDRH